MTLTLSFQWWMIPAVVTILAYCWALFWPFDNNNGLFAGLVNLVALVPASILSLVTWIVAGFLK